jgi:hypothetical protein
MWSTGARLFSVSTNDSSFRTSPTAPETLGEWSLLTAFWTRSSLEEMTVTCAPASRNADAAPNPILVGFSS